MASSSPLQQGSDPPIRKPSPDSPPKSATSSKFTTGPPRGLGSTKKLVVTVPPWAKHEQPVPDEDIFLSPITAYTAANGSNLRSTSSHERMPSDIASFTSSAPEQAPSGNWWTFTVPRMIKPVISESHGGEGRDGSVTPTSTSGDHDLEKAPRRRISKPRPGLKQIGRNRSSWIFGYALQTVGSNKGKEKRPEDLEYFGRPVGLWQTSAKLLHTLLEVVFICAWSASLALCFNDFFTTPLECGPASADRWWSDLPVMPNEVAERFQGTAEGRTLCREQLALICLAFVTLSSYCSNLVISLFRIIEKVKNYSRRSTYWN
ncbi:hypothetical protein M407DRAFT_6555 [Tulasnella calospora MUT 4182]|uniref:Uncharacterized protein n=1 Tax=Tulasnella calospora MUT 4182 TaxID=1051891 RepID=A0A0C3QD27_9AGAM|nr:hypothetical protein M407DRAFT_6555 [Tulasnella calospora MUT 4182]